MINTLLLVMCLVTSGARHKVHGTQNVLQEDLELERQLELLNKPPIKSIHVFYILFIYHHILPYVEHNITSLFKIFI